MLNHRRDVDLTAKPAEWERFYNLARPHGACNGKTPYETLRDKLYSTKPMSRQIDQVTVRCGMKISDGMSVSVSS